MALSRGNRANCPGRVVERAPVGPCAPPPWPVTLLAFQHRPGAPPPDLTRGLTPAEIEAELHVVERQLQLLEQARAQLVARLPTRFRGRNHAS